MPPGLRLCVFDSAVEVQEVLPQFSALCRSCIRTFFHFQLVRLYVQKGHAASDCKRFLKRPKRLLSFFGAPLSGYVCVCVSPLVPKGSLPHTLFQPSRGPAADKQTLANKAMLVRWMHSLINCVYLRSTFAQAVLLSFCFHGGFARYTPKQVSLRRFPLLRGRSHASTSVNTSVELILRHSVPFPHRFDVELSSRKTLCLSVCRSAVPLGCRV